MDESKPDDTCDSGERGSLRVVESIQGEITGFGGTVFYSYNLVHSQESLRVLDLRYSVIGAREPGFVQRVLRTIGKYIYKSGNVRGYQGYEIEFEHPWKEGPPLPYQEEDHV